MRERPQMARILLYRGHERLGHKLARDKNDGKSPREQPAEHGVLATLTGNKPWVFLLALRIS